MEYLFVSYAHDDRWPFTERFLQDLRDLGWPIWVDNSEIRVGTENWGTAVRKAIENASKVVLVATPSAARSRQVQHELALATMYRKPIFAV